MNLRKMLSATLCLSAWAGVTRADVVTDWNGVLLDVVREADLPAPVAARAFAMMNVAMFDSINTFEKTHEAYLVDVDPAFGAVADVVAAAAARRVLVVLFPDREADFNAAFDNFLPDLPEIVFTPSNDFGIGVANAILDFREGDFSDVDLNYNPAGGAGEWQPTPPDFEDALLPNWQFVTPFGIASGGQFRPSGPPDLTSARYTEDYGEAVKYGEAGSPHRTDGQTEAAEFWSDPTGTNTAPGHWIEIAMIIAEDEGNTPAQNARVFALLSIALADAAVVAWDAKYAHDDWRPFTAIHALDDGNADTTPDLLWEPLLDTPPHPGYVSANAAFAGAATKMMEIIYGRDGISFSATSDNNDATRTFGSLSGAAEEAADASIWAGATFAYAGEDGLIAGRALAAYVHATRLQRLIVVTAPSSDGCAPGGCGPGGLFTSMMLLVAYPVMRRTRRRRRN
ncbi:MAG TPA: vanadium-dependent haloperoxidase [Phycisphaerae bacterium]|nr:vanadium-dependent haloperoxidase [Phycisphaerae bacterium]